MGRPVDPPTFDDVRPAARRIAPHWPPTPVLEGGPLDRRFGASLHLKMEAFSATGSFKARGVLNRVLAAGPDELARGVGTASTGNHGVAVAWAARRGGWPATVVLPASVPPFKRQAIQDLGARVVVEGKDWNESLLVARRLADRDGLLMVDDGEARLVMAGAATLTLELLDQVPDLDTLVYPVGGGNLLASGALVANALRPDVRLVGVQAGGARGTHDSLRGGRIVSRPVDTFAGGIATAAPARLAYDVLGRLVDDVPLVRDDEMLAAMGLLLASHGAAVEGAAAAPLAAVMTDPAAFAGRRVGLVVTGRAVDPPTIRRALESLEERRSATLAA